MLNILSQLNLTSAELLLQERSLEAWFRRFLAFDSCSLYFPASPPDQKPWLLADEKKLFVPLRWHENILGVLLLAGVSLRNAKRLLPWIDQIATACLQTMVLARRIRTEPESGLATEEAFFAHFENQTAILQATTGNPTLSSRGSGDTNKLCIGLVVLDFHDAQRLIRSYDHELCETLLLQAARQVAASIPDGAVAARLGRYEGLWEIAVLFPAFGRKVGHELSRLLLRKIDRMELADKTSGKSVGLRMYAGHALYPQDMQGNEFIMPPMVQAIRLRDRARYASLCAWRAHGRTGTERIFAFAGILQNGGTVLENIGQGKVRVSLGSAANAREGMRFSIHGHDKNGGEIRKGQLVLLQTGRTDSFAEVLYLAQPGMEPEEGDRIKLIASGLDEADWPEVDTDDNPSACNLLLKSHADFLKAFGQAAAQCGRFTLAIARIDLQGVPDCGFYGKLEQQMTEWSENLSLPDLAGLYGSNGMIFFHANAVAAECIKFVEALAKLAADCKCGFACGIFAFPFLNFTRSDSEQCALKALEYAQLLPAPHIGVLDSTALNISADKLFSLGDTFAAIREYKLAILADPRNAMALNSIGVCMCAIGKNAAGRQFFMEALEVAESQETRAKIYYNLGTLAQKDGDTKAATKYYRLCARNDKKHVFAFIRLGQILQASGRKAQARRYYRHAINSARGNAGLLSMAERHLARLEAMVDRNAAAELLHDTLLRNPDDPASLTLLASLYLEDGEDAGTAETLARQSVRLGGGREALAVLEKALAAQGRTEEAAEVRKRNLRSSPDAGKN